MRLLIDDSFATSVYTAPVHAGWVAAPTGFAVDLVPGLTAATIEADIAALAPTSTLARLAPSHLVVRETAAVSEAVGDIAMRTPVRPDEIDRSPVRLLGASELAETLARAVLDPFYGITPTAWVRDDASPDAARAQVVIVAGAEAMREPEGGFSEDLVRSWFILTAMPVVTHVTLVPRSSPAADVRVVTEYLAALRASGLAHRGEWIPALVAREGIPRDHASAFWAAQRLALTPDDDPAITMLLRGGAAGNSGANLASVHCLNASEIV